MVREFNLIKKFKHSMELRTDGKLLYVLYMPSTDSSLFLSIDDYKDLKEYFCHKAQKEVLEKIYTMFSERTGSSFCGCYEGDINEYYKPGIISFLKELREHLGIHNSLMLLDSKNKE